MSVPVPNNDKIREILDQNLDFTETIRKIFLASPINLTLDLRLEKIGLLECRFSVFFHTPLTNLYGTVQGGVEMACDAAIWTACVSALGSEIDLLRHNFLFTSSLSVELKLPVEAKKHYEIVAHSSGLERRRNRQVMSGWARILDGDGREMAILYSTKILKHCPQNNGAPWSCPECTGGTVVSGW